jgi:acyl-CoA synthetase (AMP-forming)/AMP-acid ligase II
LLRLSDAMAPRLPEAFLLHQLIHCAASRTPDAPALSYGGQTWDYAALQAAVDAFAAGLVALHTGRGERVGIWLEKRFETVVASFGAPAAGAVMVPMNPLLKPEQVAYIASDCNVRVLVTSPERLALLAPLVEQCPDLRHVVLTEVGPSALPLPGRITVHVWEALLASPACAGHRVIDTDVTAILYTSGSTGRPKGVVLSHRNMVAGAKSVASYLENRPADSLLAALPLSFDAGFSQLTTAFHAGARVVLLNYLLPRDVLKAMARERVTGLTAVPPLYIQLTQLDWPAEAADSINKHLRYFANTGGRMPRETLEALRARMPRAQPFLMYGLTEAFRFDRQGHSQRRDPGAARGRQRVRRGRAGRTRAPRRPGRTGLLG